MENTMQNITNALNGKAGQFGLVITTETEPTMRKTNNPYVGRVRKVTEYVNPMVGASYENMVNNRIERTTNFDPSFKADKPSGRHHHNDFCDQSDKNADTYYLRIGKTQATHTTTQFYLDGAPATADEVKAIKAFIPEKPTFTKTQTHAGLEEKNNVQWLAVNTDNVLRITQGERTIYQRSI